MSARDGEETLGVDPAAEAFAGVTAIGRIRSAWAPGDCPRNLRQAVEHHHAVPLGFLDEIAALAILALFRGGDADVGDRQTARGGPRFRIRTQVAHQDDLVDTACHVRDLALGMCLQADLAGIQE